MPTTDGNLSVVAVNHSIFSPAIEQHVIPPGVKLPKIASLYLGTTIPSEHLDNYAVHMAPNLNHDVLKCKLFGITLRQHTQTWYVNLPHGSVGSFPELTKKFTTQFYSCEPIQHPTKVLHKIVQGPNKSLQDYICRFTRTVLTVTDFNDQIGSSAFVSNIHPTKQYKYLIGHHNTQSFTILMEAAASHALTKEKISLFAEPVMPIVHAPPPPSLKHNPTIIMTNQTDQIIIIGQITLRSITTLPMRRDNNRPSTYGQGG